MKVGIVGVQGDVSEHELAARSAGEALGIEVETVVARDSGILDDCDVIMIPGGESTTISNLLKREGMDDEVIEHYEQGKPILATCAGLIILSRDPKDERVENLGILDAVIERNAFGRQKESFEADIEIDGLDEPFHAVFIRAPVIESVGDEVEVISEFNDEVVGIKQGPIVATSFHPELTGDYRLHELVFSMAQDVKGKKEA